MIKFPFVLNVKLIILRYPKIWAHYSLIIMCSNIGTPKTINFPFGTNGKLMILGVPILMLLGYCWKPNDIIKLSFLLVELLKMLTVVQFEI